MKRKKRAASGVRWRSIWSANSSYRSRASSSTSTARSSASFNESVAKSMPLVVTSSPSLLHEQVEDLLARQRARGELRLALPHQRVHGRGRLRVLVEDSRVQ